MSVKVMSWVFENSRSTLGDRLVLLTIADHANHDGLDAYPSIDHLARKALVSRSTVKRAIVNLIELGELAVEAGSGRGHTSRYRVLMEGAQSEPLSHVRGSNTAIKGFIHEKHASLLKPSITTHAREASAHPGQRLADARAALQGAKP